MSNHLGPLLLNQALGDSSFKKYNHDKGKYEGAVSLPVYEALTVGISTLIESGDFHDAEITDLVKVKTKALTQKKSFIDIKEKRPRPIDRMVTMAALGKELFYEN